MGHLKTPKEYFGKQPGDDRVMIHWDQLCAYYREADKLSDRMILEKKGKTSEGNDFLIIYVSAPENLSRIEEYRQISMKLADPRGLTQTEIDTLAGNGKPIVFQSYGLHSNEVGGPQMVPLMLYELLTSEEERIKKILNEVIFIISPCSEPDGEIIFTEWYNKHLGTNFEGCYAPYLRHNYAGHANNRDALRESVIESRHLNDIIIRRFMPQIVQDHHQRAEHRGHRHGDHRFRDRHLLEQVSFIGFGLCHVHLNRDKKGPFGPGVTVLFYPCRQTLSTYRKTPRTVVRGAGFIPLSPGQTGPG